MPADVIQFFIIKIDHKSYVGIGVLALGSWLLRIQCIQLYSSHPNDGNNFQDAFWQRIHWVPIL